jgi:hypothetical protein
MLYILGADITGLGEYRGGRSGHGHSASRSPLAQPEMSPVVVIVADVLCHQAFQVLWLAKIPSGPKRARSLRLKARANRRMRVFPSNILNMRGRNQRGAAE